jgi:hypothetical protein
LSVPACSAATSASCCAAATPPATWDTRATCRRSKIGWLAYKCLDCLSLP